MMICRECGPTRKKTYHHESGDMLCVPCLVKRALAGRRDFRSKIPRWKTVHVGSLSRGVCQCGEWEAGQDLLEAASLPVEAQECRVKEIL